jgi:alkanesulfonate monooxygenase SsuD/methylene tetrahydromethanopterin reductase-like flavin-dependent oxidoreductase (luciferase family)
MAIKISVELSHVCPLDDITRHAEVLETSGFHRVWVPDTLVSPWEAWIAASIIMQNTKRVEIGLGVTNPYTRHPVVAAQMAATMQNASGGRLSLSIGKGIGRFLEKAGVAQADSAVEECITVMRSLIAGTRTSIDGDAFNIDGMQLRTTPPKKPVPFFLAAIGPPSWEVALRIADGIATIWNPRSAETRAGALGDRTDYPTAALVPFSQKRDDFFPQRLSSLEELREQTAAMSEAGFDEIIIAYADIKDLETAAKLM